MRLLPSVNGWSLMIAKSLPEQKDTVIALIVNMLVEDV